MVPAFSPDLEKTLNRALVIAEERHTPPSNVHLGLALSEDVFVGELLRACDVDPEPLRKRLRSMAGPPRDGVPPMRRDRPDEAFSRTVQLAMAASQAAGRGQLGPPQAFAALLDRSDEIVSRALRESGVTRYDMLRYISHGIRKLGAEQAVDGEPDASFSVKLFNDDYTPMAFVVSVLRDTFGHAENAAIRLMLDIHRTGVAECGVYPHEIAAAKVAAVAKLARDGQHPLHCVMETREV